VVATSLLAATMAGALLVHTFVIGTGPQSIVVLALLSGIIAVSSHHRARVLKRLQL
jgi:hypothetical protein